MIIFALWLSGILCGYSHTQYAAQHHDLVALFDIQVPSSLHAPATTAELQQIVRQAAADDRPISIVGAGKSQGGQTISLRSGAYRISLHKLCKVRHIDLQRQQITVEAGATWRQLQEAIAPHGLAVKAMQSYNDFSIGGSLSVNVHGQDLSTGQLIGTVLSLEVMLVSGELITVTRETNPDLFAALVGGYGLIGIITAVTLWLTDDTFLERKTATIPTNEFAAYFAEHIQNDPAVEFYSARFSIGSGHFMEQVLVITYERMAGLQDGARYPLGAVQQSALLRWLMTAVGAVPLVKDLRFTIAQWVLNLSERVSRNNYLNYSIAGLPQSDERAEYILQEYFIPYEQLLSFIEQLRATTVCYAINVLNVTARHVRCDTESLLSYAPHGEMCALVLYLKVPRTAEDRTALMEWTRLLIDAAIDCQGTYYLPYHTFATQGQFEAVYPQWSAFLRIKEQYDPQGLLSNQLFERYGTSHVSGY